MTRDHRPPDRSFMLRALELAERARPSPNPRVGAVVVLDGAIVGEGFHESPGMPHAEVLALNAAGPRANGADLYVTLEPCCHSGLTGPCTEVICKAGPDRVFFGMLDPDPRVAGNGKRQLEEQGFQVQLGPCEDECAQLLRGYCTHREMGRPLVHLKAAVTLDGALASSTGDSRWITGKASRTIAHQLRARVDAVVVGVQTVLTDDPMLTVRHVTGVAPTRVVLDPSLRIPSGSKLLTSAKESPLLLVHCGASQQRVSNFSSLNGVSVLECERSEDGKIDIADLVTRLGEMGMVEILVEGGAKIHGAFVKAGMADHFSLFVAPKLLGSGKPWLAFDGIATVADAVNARIESTRPVGDDLLVEGSLLYNNSN